MKVNRLLRAGILCTVLTCIICLVGCQPAGAPDQSPETALFLVQTGATSYTLIDVKHQTAEPYNFLVGNQQYDLAAGISPNGTQMILPISDRKVVILNLTTGKTLRTYELETESQTFQLEQAAEEAKKYLPDLNYSDQRLIMALEDAYRQSRMKIKWFMDEEYLLTVLDGSEGSTSLALENHLTGSLEQLENKPGLVEDYWIEPGGDRILLKKGFVFDTGISQDDRYYLVDTNSGIASSIPLPSSTERPLVFWHAQNIIGITHKPELLGGTRFSIVNATTMELDLILEGTFTSINTLGSNMLSCHQNQDNISTKFLLRKPNGQMIDSQTIDGLCSVKAILNAYKLLINCQDKSMILEENPFSITPFGKSIQIIALSPDRSQLVILFADQTAVLLTDSLVEIESLRLQKTPNEIHWLPDSSGFLYRAIDQLHYHNLTSQADLFLVSSDFFFDYRNLNAVWVHIK